MNWRHDPKVIEHAILLKKDVKPFKQPQQHMNPKVAPVIQRELQKLLEAHIITSIKYLNWVANVVPDRKKNGEIQEP